MNLTAEEKKNYRIILIATFLDAFFISIGSMMDIIAKKALDATNAQISILIMVWPATIFLSLWWARILQGSPNRSKFYWVIAIGGRLILLTSFWVADFYTYLLLMIMVYSSNSLFLPLQNSILQNNFRPNTQGRLFGYMASLSTTVVLIVSMVSGVLLDRNEDWFRPMFAIFGVMGFIAMGILSTIKIQMRIQPDTLPPMTLRELIFSPIVRSWKVLIENKSFGVYELGFFIYGIGFLMVGPVLPEYLVKDLNLSYTMIFLAKTIVAQLGVLVLSPLIGRINDRWHPRRLCGYAFVIMATYGICLLTSSYPDTHFWQLFFVFSGFLLFGVAMSALNISWNVGTIFFAGNRDVSVFQGVHLTLVGIRGLLAPPLALLILDFTGIRGVFMASVVFFIGGAIISFRKTRGAA